MSGKVVWSRGRDYKSKLCAGEKFVIVSVWRDDDEMSSIWGPCWNCEATGFSRQSHTFWMLWHVCDGTCVYAVASMMGSWCFSCVAVVFWFYEKRKAMNYAWTGTIKICSFPSQINCPRQIIDLCLMMCAFAQERKCKKGWWLLRTTISSYVVMSKSKLKRERYRLGKSAKNCQQGVYGKADDKMKRPWTVLHFR